MSEVFLACFLGLALGAVLAWVVHGSDSADRRAAVEVACPEQCWPVYERGAFTCEARR